MDGSSARKNATLICAPIIADSVDQMLANLAKAKYSGADLVEIRLDTLKTFSPQEDINTLIKGSALPTLFTYRPKWEGRQYEGDEESRLDALRLAMELGADYVATEFNDSICEKSPPKCKIIISSHNYENTPSVEGLGNLVAKIQSAGADIVKIATTASDIPDVARMFHITAHSQDPVIGIVMGERGLMSRVLSAKFGSFLTFATLESGIVSAPGQPTIKDLLDLYNFRSIGPDTKVYGIIGKPVGHIKSPILYNEAFKAVSFNGVYVHLLVDDISSFFRTYSSTDFVWFSVTIPHKEAAVNCCDEVDPVAKSIGAINLVVRRERVTRRRRCSASTNVALDGIDTAWFAEFLNKSGNSLNVATHLIYKLRPGFDAHLIEKILDPTEPDSAANTFRSLQSTLKSSATSAVAWVGEAGEAYNSGRNTITNAFVFNFWISSAWCQPSKPKHASNSPWCPRTRFYWKCLFLSLIHVKTGNELCDYGIARSCESFLRMNSGIMRQPVHPEHIEMTRTHFHLKGVRVSHAQEHGDIIEEG